MAKRSSKTACDLKAALKASGYSLRELGELSGLDLDRVKVWRRLNDKTTISADEAIALWSVLAPWKQKRRAA